MVHAIWLATMARQHLHPHLVPAAVAAAVAVIGLVALLLVDHGPWNKPKIQNETMIQYGDTAAAANASAPAKPELNRSHGPKPVQPAIPDQSKS